MLVVTTAHLSCCIVGSLVHTMYIIYRAVSCIFHPTQWMKYHQLNGASCGLALTVHIHFDFGFDAY